MMKYQILASEMSKISEIRSGYSVAQLWNIKENDFFLSLFLIYDIDLFVDINCSNDSILRNFQTCEY